METEVKGDPKGLVGLAGGFCFDPVRVRVPMRNHDASGHKSIDRPVTRQARR